MTAAVTGADVAWLACAVDGEGWINIGKSEGYLRITIGVCNTNWAFVAKAAMLMGTTIRKWKHKGSLGKKPIYVTTLHGSRERVLVFLRSIEPALIIKRDKALKGISLIEEKGI